MSPSCLFQHLNHATQSTWPCPIFNHTQPVDMSNYLSRDSPDCRVLPLGCCPLRLYFICISRRDGRISRHCCISAAEPSRPIVPVAPWEVGAGNEPPDRAEWRRPTCCRKHTNDDAWRAPAPPPLSVFAIVPCAVCTFSAYSAR